MNQHDQYPTCESGLAAALSPGTEAIDNLAFVIRNASIVYQTYILAPSPHVDVSKAVEQSETSLARSK